MNTWYEKGQASVDVGRYQEALDHFEKAIKEDPNHAGSYSEAALVCIYTDRLPKALPYSEKALSLAPSDPTVNINHGIVLSRLNRREEATERFESVINSHPEMDLAYFRYGQALMTMGDLSKAEAVFRRAIELNPTRAHNFYQLTRLVKLQKEDPAFQKLEEMMASADQYSPGRHANFHYSYGQALYDQGEFERSFEHFLKANSLHRPNVDYDEAFTLRHIRSVFKMVERSTFMKLRGLGNPSAAPIFIVSMPRTGSTLVEQILSHHPLVCDLEERGTIERTFERVGGFALSSPAHGEEYGNVVTAKLKELGDTYLKIAYASKPEAKTYKRFTNKNLVLFQYVGWLHLALPNAKFIQVERSILDSCMSIFSLRFSGLNYAYDLKELGRYFRLYYEAMDHWKSMLPENSLLTVRYEHVVNQLEVQTRKMLDFCDLPWDTRCLAFHENKRIVNTSSNAQVRRPLYRDSLRRWRPSEEQLQPFFDGLGEQLTRRVQEEEMLKWE